LASSAVVAVACGKDKTPTSAMNADLKRDLQLASATQNIRINPDEVTPISKQELSLRPKRAPDGPKVIRTDKPTVKASAKAQQVAEIKTDLPAIQVAASSPAPSETPTPDAPPLARPSPIPSPRYPSTGAMPGAGSGGSGGTMGGIFGTIIRGGGVGDDDHCDPRGGPQRGRPVGGDIFGGLGGISGMGGARGVPIHPIGRSRP
jgi:hypothetical protein